MNIDEKYELITRRLEEFTHANKIKDILKERDLKVYWGTATTGKPHVGYLVPISKIADFLHAGCEVTILFADLHAFLDNEKTANWDLLKYRTKYYENVIKETIKAMGVDVNKLKFVRGTDFQLSQKYSLDVYKLTAATTVNGAIHAGAEVVKQADSPKLAPVLYPLLQALDEEHLGVDAQFGGQDQRKIFMFAEDYLPKLGMEKRIHLMSPMVPGLSGGKMSSSEVNSKVDLVDDDEIIIKKFNKAFCPEKEINSNGVILLAKHVIFPHISRLGGSFVIERPEKFGGNLTFSNYESLEESYVNGNLHPLDLKLGIGRYISNILKPVREHFSSKEMQELSKDAYP